MTVLQRAGLLLLLSSAWLWLALLPAAGLTLWSTPGSYLGPGKFFGPGANMADQELFPVIIRNMIFVSERDFVTPFANNGPLEPNIFGEVHFRGEVDGRLSDGSLINENVDIWPYRIGGMDLLIAVIAGGPHQGQQLSITSDQGEVLMTMDLALDLGIGDRGVVRLPFYGTTGSVVVPYSLQTQGGGKGVDRAGPIPSGAVLNGRIGDFNRDGWIDGTLVAAGTLPLSSPIYPGQPYALVRHFETDIPIDGAIFGDVASLKRSRSKVRRDGESN